jgi:hypothetical protein
MPTTDDSNTTRIARVRQAAISVGVSKAGNSRSSSMHMARVLGGVPIKIKNSAGLSLNNAPVDTSGNPLVPGGGGGGDDLPAGEGGGGGGGDDVLLQDFNFVKAFYAQPSSVLPWVLYTTQEFSNLNITVAAITGDPDLTDGPSTSPLYSALNAMTFLQWKNGTPENRNTIKNITMRVSRAAQGGEGSPNPDLK